MSDQATDYLNQIAKYPLLTQDQEIQLGRRVARWRELKDKPNLTLKERQELRSGERARQKFINSNLLLVAHVARRYQRRVQRTMEYLDIVQEGNIGLARAVELFDYSKGYKFSTYAYWWIKQAIMRGILATDDIIRLPVNVHDKIRNANKTFQRLAQENGRLPSLEEVANETDINSTKLAQLYQHSYRITSLDAHASESDSTILDLIADPNQYDPEREICYEHLEDCIEKYLDSQTRDIIKARMQPVPVTWRELAQLHGVNRESLQHKYRCGLRKLRMRMTSPLRNTPLGAINGSI